MDRTVDLLRTKYSKAEISYEGIHRRETPLVPEEALREAVLNAIAHRDYSNPTPIQISVHDNRIDLYNPGNLPLGWTVESLLDTHKSVPHNPRVANAFFSCWRDRSLGKWSRQDYFSMPISGYSNTTMDDNTRRAESGICNKYCRSKGSD